MSYCTPSDPTYFTKNRWNRFFNRRMSGNHIIFTHYPFWALWSSYWGWFCGCWLVVGFVLWILLAWVTFPLLASLKSPCSAGWAWFNCVIMFVCFASNVVYSDKRSLSQWGAPMLTICSDEVASVCVTICLCCCAYVAVAINRRACNWTYMRLTGRSPSGLRISKLADSSGCVSNHLRFLTSITKVFY